MPVENKTGSTKKDYLIIGTSVLVIFPFLVLHYFNQPLSEDFFYPGITRESGFLDAQRYFYKFWGGRISYYALTSFNPLYFYSISGYVFLTFLIFLLFFYVLYSFVSEFTKEMLNHRERFLIVLSVSFLYLYSMPSVGQGFYWLGSALNYHLAMILVMMFYISYSRINDSEIKGRKIFYTAICFILATVIGGFNELTALVFSASVLLLFLRDFFIEKRLNLYLFVFAVLTLTADYICFSAPGNINRADTYLHSQDEYYSFINTLIFVSEKLLYWIFYSPLLAVTFLLIPVFFKIAKSGKPFLIYSLHPLISAALLIFFLFTGTFIMIWSNGIVPYDRILNYLYFLFLIGWFYNAVVLIIHLNRKYNFASFKLSKYAYAVAFLIILIFMFRENNITSAYSDLFSGKAKNFHNAMNMRYSEIQNNINDSIIVDPVKNIPASLFFQEIDYLPGTVYNLGYQMYFKKKAIVLRK